jgi:hypothetical protein
MNPTFTSYIQFQDFETLITSYFPHEKANIIEKILADVLNIVPNGKKFKAYIKRDDQVHVYTHHIKLILISTVVNLLELSFHNLTEEQQYIIKSQFPTQYHQIFHEKSVKEYYRELFFKLLNLNH